MCRNGKHPPFSFWKELIPQLSFRMNYTRAAAAPSVPAFGCTTVPFLSQLLSSSLLSPGLRPFPVRGDKHHRALPLERCVPGTLPLWQRVRVTVGEVRSLPVPPDPACRAVPFGRARGPTSLSPYSSCLWELTVCWGGEGDRRKEEFPCPGGPGDS